MVTRKRFFLFSFFSFLVLASLCFRSASYASSWHWQARPHDLWGEMSAHFTLINKVPAGSIEPDVQRLLKNKPRLNRITHNAYPFIAYIYQETQVEHMPAEIALLPIIESRFLPFAYSKTGATGLWQLMPGTAAGYHLSSDWWFDGRRDTIRSTQTALSYLSYLHGFFHDWLLAIAAYNAGEGRILRAIRYNIKHHKSVDFWSLSLPQETRVYVPKLLAIAEIIAHRDVFDVALYPVSIEAPFTQVALPHAMSLDHLAALLEINESEFRTYNAGFRRASTGPYWHHVYIPSSHLAQFKAWQKRHAVHPSRDHRPHYRVQAGDTLAKVAHRERATVSQLMHLNKLSSPLIHPGQVLLVPGVKRVVAAAHHLSVKTRAITEEGIPGPKHITHVVKRYDSYSRIARKYHVTINQIRYWNNLSQHHRLRVGEVIHLWRGGHHRYHTKVYRVKVGDTLGRIARAHGVTVAQIKRLNHLRGSIIRVGQRLSLAP